jgi:hypothetical protein
MDSIGIVPYPKPSFILSVKENSSGKGYVVELPYGPVYFFETMKECSDFVASVLKRYEE